MRRLILVFASLAIEIGPLYAQQSTNWVKATDQTGWEPRDSQGEVVYRDKLWIFGGWFNSYAAPPRDVWSSMTERVEAGARSRTMDAQRPIYVHCVRRQNVVHGWLVQRPAGRAFGVLAATAIENQLQNLG